MFKVTFQHSLETIGFLNQHIDRLKPRTSVDLNASGRNALAQGLKGEGAGAGDDGKDISYSGVLWKRGHRFMHSWNMRYFVYNAEKVCE